MAKRPQAKPQVVQQVAETTSTAQMVAWYCLLALVFLVPVVMSNLTALGATMPLTYDQFDLPKLIVQRIFGFVGLAAWGWHILTRGGKIRFTPIDFLIVGFLAWVGLSSVFSIHIPTALFGKYRRFEGLFSFINYAVVYFLAMQFADRPSRMRSIAKALFFSGMFVTFYGILQYMGADPSQWGKLPFEANRAFSTYGNPDLLGGFLCFSVFVSLGLALSEDKLWLRGVYWLGFLMSCFVTVIAFVRGAWIGVFVGFVLFAVILWRQRPAFKMEDGVFAGVSVAAVAAGIIRSLSSTNEVMNFAARLKSITVFNEGSAKTRFEIWQAAIDAIKDRPIFGFGADTFRLVFPKYKPAEYVKDAGYLSVADNVHDYPLQLATGIGIPGVALLYSIITWAAIRSGKVVFGRRQGTGMMVMAGFWVACAAYVTHLFFGLSVTGTSVLFWLSMGVVLSPTAKVIEVKPVSMGYVWAGVVALAAAGIVIFNVTYAMADNAYLMSRVVQGEDRVAYTQKAVKLNPWNDMYRAEVGLAYADTFYQAIGAYQQEIQAGNTSQASQYLVLAEQYRDLTISALDSVIEFVPYEYDNYNFLAGIYNTAGQLWGGEYDKKAIEVGRKGVEVEEYGPAIRYQLAVALKRTGEDKEAIEQLQVAHDLDPAYVDAAVLLAQYKAEAGDVAGALKVLEESAPFAGGDTTISSLIEQYSSTTTTQP